MQLVHFAAMWAIYNSTDLSKKNDMDSDAYWILGLGGVWNSIGFIFVWIQNYTRDRNKIM